MLHRIPTSRWALPRACSLLLAALLGVTATHAATKTVCTVTINSADEKETFQRHLPHGDYRFVELVQRGQPDWLASACRRGVNCDVLIVSGHFDDGSEFYTDRFDDREFLTVHELQRASCSASCSGLFAPLKEVYLFGCNTLKSEPRHVAGAEIVRSLQRSGHPGADAERLAVALGQRYGQSNRDRLRQIFKDVPVLYGFASKAPLGRVAGPLLERYFQAAPAGQVGAGRPSPPLLELFGPSSMIAVAGLTDADPQAGLRRDICGFADEQRSDAQKIAFMHQLLQREPGELRLFLDHLERQAAAVGPAQRLQPEVAAALAAIASDGRARDRFLEFARDADTSAVRARMLALARTLGWLSPAQEQAEFLQMLAERSARRQLGPAEVELTCSAHPGREPELARRLQALAGPRDASLALDAVLACLGSADAHRRTVQALTSARDDEVALTQAYLRHRPLADAQELRALTAGIARMSAAAAQARALEALARLRLADPQSLQELARLFPAARSLEVQRAIAGILIRADTTQLPRAELARTLRRHRLQSPDGGDVIEMLIRVLQSG